MSWLKKDLFFFKTQAMRTLGKTLSFHGIMIKSHVPVLRHIATHIIPLDMSSCIFLTVYQQGSNSSICRLMSYWWCQGVNSFTVLYFPVPNCTNCLIELELHLALFLIKRRWEYTEIRAQVQVNTRKVKPCEIILQHPLKCEILHVDMLWIWKCWINSDNLMCVFVSAT